MDFLTIRMLDFSKPFIASPLEGEGIELRMRNNLDNLIQLTIHQFHRQHRGTRRPALDRHVHTAIG